ncbi:hypothetical protein B0A52_02860 [Exophiala mesophila]|uniref:Transcription factor domain-containing protein n=1 Tax=Exophiala mesophila TaxID=212818 RepID=A0A438NE25_EXOME|nr:hypothetical protein B0A52_02860 [Exophiala mesophila]
MTSPTEKDTSMSSSTTATTAGTTNSTFLVWVPGAKNKSTRETRQQVFQQHRHAALVHHQRRKERRSQEPSRIVSKALCRFLPSPTTAEHPNRVTPTLTSHLLSPSPPIDPDLGRFDPFDTLCVRGPSTNALALVQFALHNQWPAFASSSMPGTVESWKKKTMAFAVEAPYLLEAIAYAGACYQLFFGAADSSTRLVHVQSQHHAVKSLRQAIECSNGAVSDAMLMSMAILGIHTFQPQQNRPPVSTRSPYRDNDFHSSQVWNSTHIDALIRLVKIKGGLKSIVTTDFREMVAVIDIQSSLDVLKKPSFPLMKPSQTMMQMVYAKRPSLPETRFDPPGQGFGALRGIKGGSVMLKLIHHIRCLLEAFDMVLLQGPASGVDFHFLLATRRALQHDALSMANSDDVLYTICRLGVIAYMGESIEPHSAPRPFHTNVSKALMLALDKCDRLDYESASKDHHSLLLWSAVAGAFAARKTHLLYWYYGFIRGLRQSRGMISWYELQNEMSYFLPFKYRQGEGCRQIWEDMCTWSPSDHYSLPLS